MNARQMERTVHREHVDTKFKNMVNHQQKIIKENMLQGYNSVLWIFSDKAYYSNPFEKCWFDEFNIRAKELFESAGYKIKGITITW